MPSARRHAPVHDTSAGATPARHAQARDAPADGRRSPSRSPRSGGDVDLTRPRHRRPGHRWRLLALASLVFLLVVGAVVVVAERQSAALGAETLGAEELSAEERAPAPMLVPSAASPLPAATTPPPAVLRLSGSVPSAGRGTFGYDDRVGPVLGESGPLRRYRVAVESGADEDAGEFATAVGQALAGPGSWVDGGLRLQQVRADARHDFTVYLATARTAGQLCAAGGVNIRIDGRPYTSCRAPGKVIINLERWRLSVPHFVSAKVPLSVYRTYVVNHEVGHQLGHRHERCPGKGRVAPVMMQQTLFLNGCVANPWPYRDGRRYAGPPL